MGLDSPGEISRFTGAHYMIP